MTVEGDRVEGSVAAAIGQRRVSTLRQQHPGHHPVSLLDRDVERRLHVMVRYVTIGIRIQQDSHGIVECQIDGDVQRGDDLPSLAAEHCVVHEVRIGALVQHVLDDPRFLLASGEDQRAGELLGRTVLDVGRA